MANITTADLAEVLETDGRTARKFLRSITPKDEQPGKGSRWAIDGNKRHIHKLEKQFSEWKAAQEARRAETEQDADEETPAED